MDGGIKGDFSVRIFLGKFRGFKLLENSETVGLSGILKS